MMSGLTRLSLSKTCPTRPIWKRGLGCCGTMWASRRPAPITSEEKGVHFYGHPAKGAILAREMMNHLKFSNEEIRDVCALVDKHMRLGEYRPDWPDASVKRLIRDCGPYLDDLFTITRCDMAAVDIPPDRALDMDALRARIDALNAVSNVTELDSPLDGNEIMQTLDTKPGSHLREAKDFLLNEVIEGRLAENDKERARERLRVWWQSRQRERE